MPARQATGLSFPDRRPYNETYLGLRAEPGHNSWVSLGCFRLCYLGEILLQPIEDCLPEHLPKFGIAGGVNNRKAEIKVLFRRKDAKIGARAEAADRLRDNRPPLSKSNTDKLIVYCINLMLEDRTLI